LNCSLNGSAVLFAEKFYFSVRRIKMILGYAAGGVAAISSAGLTVKQSFTANRQAKPEKPMFAGCFVNWSDFRGVAEIG
jgi:hypothetical protein